MSAPGELAPGLPGLPVVGVLPPGLPDAPGLAAFPGLPFPGPALPGVDVDGPDPFGEPPPLLGMVLVVLELGEELGGEPPGLDDNPPDNAAPGGAVVNEPDPVATSPVLPLTV